MSESVFAFFLFAIFFLIMFFSFVNAAPVGPDSVVVQSNETKGTAAAFEFNVSGGTVSTINITSRTQNVRWKGMLGQVSGTFTLDDSSGSTLYDWSLTTTTGEIYATRNSSTISWSNVQCTNVTLLENENTLMNHTNSNDNITVTFNTSSGASHSSFVVTSATISANTCPTLNTFVNNATQDSSFEEIALTDSTNFSNGGNVIYATILEQDVVGFDGLNYDFQMIVPENGADGFSGSTAYYLYIELT